MTRLIGAILLGLMMFTTSALADGRTIKVRFGSGSDGARYSGQIVGYDDDNYILDLRGGQTLNVNLRSGNRQAYFNIASQNGEDALHNGSVSGNSFRGIVPATGRYVIQVYMMRAAARRNEVANYRLSIRVPADRPIVETPDYPPDFADGDAGGPDRWIVVGVPAGDALNIRVAPNSSSRIVARLNNRTILRNQGCRRIGSSRWCRVAMDSAPANRGWVNGRFLREY